MPPNLVMAVALVSVFLGAPLVPVIAAALGTVMLMGLLALRGRSRP